MDILVDKKHYYFLKNVSSKMMMISTYEKSLLTDLQVASQYFGIIFAILTLVQCFSVKYQDKIHNTFRNLIVGIVGLVIILLVLRYMNTRIGLNPEEYNGKDINFNKQGE